MPTGSCCCGAIKYEYNGETVANVLCHCVPCHKTTGSTNSTTVFIKDEQFNLRAGKPKQYTEKHENGMILDTFFCDNCSSAIWRTASGIPATEQFRGLRGVFVGTLDDLSELDKLKPNKELWTKFRTTWRGEIEGAVQVHQY